MEVSPRTAEFLLGPAINFIQYDELNSLSRRRTHPERQIAWHPPAQKSSWHLFRANFLSLRVSAVPNFALGRMPVRVDIHLSSSIPLDEEPWRSMMKRPCLSSKPQTGSELSDHLLSALDFWSTNMHGFENTYMTLPFGSRIVIFTLDENVQHMQIELEANYELELQWLTPKAIQEMWRIPAEVFPTSIQLSQLELITEQHETISLVRLKDKPHERFVLKSATGNPRFLYHELRMLLSMQPHANIIRRPRYLVTKQVNFGGKKGVCGFLLEYHAGGTLAATLTTQNGGKMQLETKTRWACQIASALAHVKSSPVGYYSDLKLDNIVLKESGGEYDAVLIDFEQRGSWVSWSPPEVSKLMLIIHLAATRSRYIPRSAKRKYQKLLDTYLPSYKERERDGRTQSGSHIDSGNVALEVEAGYNKSWRALSPAERDSAVVFMFGRVAWCIFEGRGSANTAEFLGAEVFREADSQHRFPEFVNTPRKVQELIRQCTWGAPEWFGLSRPIKTVGDVVYSVQNDMDSHDAESRGRATLATLRQWWAERVSEAEDYLVQRAVNKSSCRDVQAAGTRPSIEDVLQSLRKYGAEMGFGIAA
ncbi:hypothetical protein TCE0_017f04118 [Talaromyces pinophilus]|uniref:Protein kinase domain-containing protein n=1 Tax=Talaromyces pinophilus TaxID=128442 RepID=A0A6V8H3Z9_TALPI|nr:hypothetical protein TCE0_017f04118 [Talaromyces pinophilus]